MLGCRLVINGLIEESLTKKIKMRVNILMILLTICSVSNAQKMDCSKQIKEYKDFLVLKKIDESIQPWETVLKNCPKDNPELYTDGVAIYQYRIETAKSTEEKEKAFSNVFWILNRRISLFTSLPIASLDRLSLQREVKNIGQS